MKNLPTAILGLTLLLALVVLGVGTRISREETIEIVKDSRLPTTAFTARFLNEIENLTELYQGHLLDLRDSARWTTHFELASRSRNIIGVEQVTLFNQSGIGNVTDLRRGREAEIPLPTPRALGGTRKEEGILVDLEALRADEFGPGFQWLDQPGYQLHFAARLDHRQVIVFRINREIVQNAIEGWLKEYWVADALDPVQTEQIALQMSTPSGAPFTQAQSPKTGAEPSLMLPVASLFGDWKITSWDHTATIITYRLPFLIGSATISILIALAGILGYFQQRSAVRLAEQRVSFVNRVSHELRTPLTNILLNIDLAADSLAGNHRNAQHRLDLIREETGRLSRLLENVLTFSRREKWKLGSDPDARPPFKVTPCDIWQIIDAVLSQFQPSLERKGLSVEKNGASHREKVFADADALSQIISNLVSNVEKYASRGGSFEIGIHSPPGDDSRVVLQISDHGPGIRKQDSEKIFHPFTRLNDSTTEGVSGTGLGLSIARDLAEQMNGKLALKPREDSERGACFELSLPRAAGNILSIAS